MDRVADAPVRAVLVREESGTSGIFEGMLSIDDDGFRVTVGDRTIGCSLPAIERVLTDSLPAPIGGRFDDGVVVQWRGEAGRRRAIIELDGDLRHRVAVHLFSRTLSGRDVRVQQVISSVGANDGGDPERWATGTTLRIDAAAEAVEFAARELEPIDPASVTAVTRIDGDDGDVDRPCVQVKTLTPEQRVTTRVYLSSDAPATRLADSLRYGSGRATGGGPIRVLLVDDEPSLVELAKMHFAEDHDELAVRFATHTQHAVALVEDESFECIVTDYSMPEGGAPEIIDAAREHDPDVPIIVFTRKDPATIPPAEKPAGVDRWIRKEMGKEQYHRLAVIIQRLVAPRRAERQSG